MRNNQSMSGKLPKIALSLALLVLTASAFVAASDPPANPEVTAAMQP
jgi:hypothetical protein